MPETTAKAPNRGKILQSWTFPEFSSPKRERSWYIWIIIISFSVLIWSIITANYLFALIIIIVAIIFIFQNRRPAQLIECRLKEDGIETGQNFYAYEDIKNFWIVYRPPEIKAIYVDFKSALKPTLTIPLESQNPLKIRETLKKYIEEDLEKDDEPSADSIARTFKL